MTDECRHPSLITKGLVVTCAVCGAHIAGTKRRPGRPPQYADMRRLAGCMLPADLLDWFKALPGRSTHERLAWLRAYMAQQGDGKERARAEYDAVISFFESQSRPAAGQEAV